MRKYLTSVLLALIVFSSATNTVAGNPVTNAPVLKVDYAHWMSKDGAGSKSYPYRIAACASVILDATDYTFVPPERLKGKPLNLIRVHYGDFMDGNVFDLMLQPDKKRYELSTATLRRYDDARPFSGFKKDFDYIIEIGILEPNGTFNEEWITTIEVR
jgi:hypothetical protein